MKTKLSISLICMAMMTACAGPSAPRSNHSPIQYEEQVLFTDRALKRLVRLVDLKSTRLNSGQVEVTLVMQNNKKKDVWTDIQVIFLDADGVELEVGSWTPQQYSARTLATFKKTSMTPNAKDFRITVRPAKTSY